ncbi:hypothetical protein ACFY4C_36560 [Actinomadura viridis]|uniref:hypothetical protein n=1 Tax=Actinomadura viridis TaxID=58110 RepID=UPI0036AB1C6E
MGRRDSIRVQASLDPDFAFPGVVDEPEAQRQVDALTRRRIGFTFQRLAKDARSAVALDVPTGAAALEQLIDLACEIKSYDLFHSEDPVEAAGFVVSDAVSALWQGLRERRGFIGFARLAAPQLIRWEQKHGWIRSGWCRLSEKETTLATVLAGLLRAARSSPASPARS